MSRAIAIAGLALIVSACVPPHLQSPSMARREPWQAAPGAGVEAATPRALPVIAELVPDRGVAFVLGLDGPMLDDGGQRVHAMLFALPPQREASQVDVAFRYEVAARVRLLADDFTVVRELPGKRFVMRPGYFHARQATIFLNARDNAVRYVLITSERAASYALTSRIPDAGFASEASPASAVPANAAITLRRFVPEFAAASR